MYIFTKGAKRKSKILTNSDQRFWYVTATGKQTYITFAILLYYTRHHHKYIILVIQQSISTQFYWSEKKTLSILKKKNKNKNTNLLRLEDNQWPIFQLRCAHHGITTYTFTCTCKSWVFSYINKSYRVRVGPRARSLDQMNPSMTYPYLDIYSLARICNL